MRFHEKKWLNLELTELIVLLNHLAEYKSYAIKKKKWTNYFKTKTKFNFDFECFDNLLGC